jgi:hypothetical protein
MEASVGQFTYHPIMGLTQRTPAPPPLKSAEAQPFSAHAGRMTNSQHQEWIARFSPANRKSGSSAGFALRLEKKISPPG